MYRAHDFVSFGGQEREQLMLCRFPFPLSRPRAPDTREREQGARVAKANQWGTLGLVSVCSQK